MEEQECDSNCDLWQALQPRLSDNSYGILPEPTEPLRSQAEIAKELYRPIPIKGWQTRVIRLHAGGPDESLSCDLLVADIILFQGLALHEILEVVAFDALSYVWGEPKFDMPIFCNGVAYPITRNLFYALKNLRWVVARRTCSTIAIDVCCGYRTSLATQNRRL